MTVAAKVFDKSLLSIAAALRERRVRAQDLAEVALIRAKSSSSNGYRVIRGQKACLEAQAADICFDCQRDPGPWCGIPISVKDLYGVPGEQTFAGGKEALPPIFEEAGSIMRRVLSQLAVVTGKTHTVELAFGGLGTNNHWGTPRNPFSNSVHRVPGGSSSGAGTSLAEGSALVAFGTDTAGSVRIPAAWTGNVGVKTTKGRWSTEGIVPLSTTLDTPGVLTRTVDDAIYAFCAIDAAAEHFWERMNTFPRRTLKGLRLRVATGEFQENCSPGVLESVEEALVRLEKSGARVDESILPGAESALSVFSEGGPTAIELHHFIVSELPELMERLDPVVRDRVKAAGQSAPQDYLRRIKQMSDAHRLAMASFDDIDVYVTPTVASTPPTVIELESIETYRNQNLLALRNTGIVSLLGLCAVSIPCGFDKEGMPVGIQLIGPAGQDAMVLAVAQAVASTAANGS